ncbi:MAG: adenylyltransferase/cytidyltransferase family protein [Armatimonadetes bacterium]|nr:adenylyltransferase/cytidyltransferase family protein [Armatimonadota bacterium]
MSRGKVVVSGCFDLLHSGHVAFLQEASAYGELHVCIGSDENLFRLKNRWPINDQDERRYMIKALACVHEVHINQGTGLMDFVEEFKSIAPTHFVVNEDGHSADKEALCRELGVEYVVLKREPHAALKPRSTTSLRQDVRIPYRIDLAGGWLDQPWVSSLCPGPVLTISIEPTHDFDDRSGMSTSTRHTAIGLWGPRLPVGDLERMARVLFCCENPPGTPYVSGSQDSIGIVYPGLNRSNYSGEYWPATIESVHDTGVLNFLEEHLQLLPLGSRHSGYDVLADTRVTKEGAERLAQAAEDCWAAALRRDASAFGEGFRRSFEAQVEMFPNMVDEEIRRVVEEHGPSGLGYKLSGAGGGGYFILFRRDDYPGAMRVKIRRKEE